MSEIAGGLPHLNSLQKDTDKESALVVERPEANLGAWSIAQRQTTSIAIPVKSSRPWNWT